MSPAHKHCTAGTCRCTHSTRRPHADAHTARRPHTYTRTPHRDPTHTLHMETTHSSNTQHIHKRSRPTTAPVLRRPAWNALGPPAPQRLGSQAVVPSRRAVYAHSCEGRVGGHGPQGGKGAAGVTFLSHHSGCRCFRFPFSFWCVHLGCCKQRLSDSEMTPRAGSQGGPAPGRTPPHPPLPRLARESLASGPRRVSSQGGSWGAGGSRPRGPSAHAVRASCGRKSGTDGHHEGPARPERRWEGAPAAARRPPEGPAVCPQARAGRLGSTALWGAVCGPWSRPQTGPVDQWLPPRQGRRTCEGWGLDEVLKSPQPGRSRCPAPALGTGVHWPDGQLKL